MARMAALSEYIGESLSGFLKPPEPGPGNSQTRQPIDPKRGPCRQLAPDEYFACFLNHESEGVNEDPRLIFRRQGGNRVKHRRQEKHDGGDDAHGLSKIAYIDTSRCQEEGEPHGGEDQGKNDDRQENGGPGKRESQKKLGDQQYQGAD